MNNLEGIPIDKILYHNFIKYSRMDMLFEKELSGVCITEKVVNVYIDLFSFLSDIYRNTNMQSIFHLTSAIVNMGIHYRNYFFKKGVYANIIFIYSPNISPINVKYIKTWYQDYKVNMMNNPNAKNIINKNLELLLTIMPYIPDMFIKIGSVSPSVMVFDIIRVFDSKGFKYPNIFVTRDPYAFQLPSILPNTVLFIKKYKRNGDDVSYSVNHGNCVNEFIRAYKNLQVEDYIDPDWMNPYMILGGLGSKYGITSLFDYMNIFQILGQLKMQYSNYEPSDIYKAIQDLFPNTKITFEDIDKRYKCLNLFYQLAEYSVLPESKEFNWLTQMKDFETLVRINEKYFRSAPMNLDKLG